MRKVSHFFSALQKIFRFFAIYGFFKTLYKVIGRYRLLGKYVRPYFFSRHRDIGVIGCGQFTFSTVGYAICRKFGNRFVDCYDINAIASDSFSSFYRIKNQSNTAEHLFSNEKVKYVYVASNHASHSEYAVSAISQGKIVYLEKPISVSFEQLKSLQNAISRYRGKIFSGYNRPFSAAILDLKKRIQKRIGPLTLNCFVSGHDIPLGHWYRDASEGTRICGNVGHWIDLAIHILAWGELADQWRISIAYSNLDVADDNISISLTSNVGDLVVITITSRCEPFEGINETINYQCDSVICKIDDFRQMTVWDGPFVSKKSYWPKDVGHNKAVLQPFAGSVSRDWSEVIISTLMMLKIAEMVKSRETEEFISIQDLHEINLGTKIEASVTVS